MIDHVNFRSLLYDSDLMSMKNKRVVLLPRAGSVILENKQVARVNIMVV